MFFDEDTPEDEKPHPVEYPIRIFMVGVIILLGVKAYTISDFGWLLMIASWFLAIANLAVWPRMTQVVKPPKRSADSDD